MKKLLVVFTLILAFGLAGTSNAAIVDLPDDAGNGYFRDLNTGYVWMDIDNFLGMTYSEIETSLAGTDFHIASYDEMHHRILVIPTHQPILQLSMNIMTSWEVQVGAEFLMTPQIPIGSESYGECMIPQAL